MKNKIPMAGILKLIVSFVLTLIFMFMGIKCREAGLYNKSIFAFFLVFSFAIPIIAAVINLVLDQRFKNKMKSSDIEKVSLEQKAAARETLTKKLSILKRLILIGDIYAASISILGAIVAFSAGYLALGTIIPWYIFSLAYIAFGIEFIRFKLPTVSFKEIKEYLPEEEYPLLYETAYKAAARLGCKEKIKIAVFHDSSAGIIKCKGAYSVSLGTYLLDNFSRDEIYNVLLHEFYHVTDENKDQNSVLHYFDWIVKEKSFLFNLCNLLYTYLIARYTFEFVTYKFCCSVINEEDADQAMLKYGDREVAASSFLKLKFSNMYEWEQGSYPEENLFAPEEFPKDFVHRQLTSFKARMEKRKEEWIAMIDSEILARNATHPTVKMRIGALGVKAPHLIEKNDTPEYLSEVDKAISHVEKIIYEHNVDKYPDIREANYLGYIRILEKWENEGKKITKENYSDIIYALFMTGKIQEFVNLCYQIINEMPEPASCYAYHMLGCHMLHTYDERGIDYLYKGIELNYNHWEEAIDTIGNYACSAGKQDKLEEYRKRAREIVERAEEFYNNIGYISNKDNIVEENLPADLLKDFLDYVNEINDGVIDKIYMVRKVINADDFTTCVVVQAEEKCDEDKFRETMSKIFQYLDKSSSWQYSLFDIRDVNKKRILRIKNSCIFDNNNKK